MDGMSDEEREELHRSLTEHAQRTGAANGVPQEQIDKVVEATKLMERGGYIEAAHKLNPTVTDDTLLGIILGCEVMLDKVAATSKGDELFEALLLDKIGEPPIAVSVLHAALTELQMRRSADKLAALEALESDSL